MCFLIIDLDFLIPAIIAQTFNTILELVLPIGIPTKEAKAEMEMHPVTSVLNIIQNFTKFFMLLIRFFCFSLSFFPRTARRWNSLPTECFPLTYDLNGFKSRINRHLLTAGFF